MMLIFRFFGLAASEIHGDMNQRQRMESVESFQRGEVNFLMATDLLSRGFDIHQVQTVINYSFPVEDSRYVHRVGRTARAGNSGTAITLANEDERKEVKRMAKQGKSQAKPFTVSQALVQKIGDSVALLQDYIKTLIKMERKERELLLAVIDANKAQNLLDHTDEIKNRPKKDWFVSGK